MNTKKILISGLVALALSAVAGRAQTIAGGTGGGQTGDLVLGFENANQTNNVIFDIGQFTSFENLAPGTYTVGGFSSTDLTTALGTDATNGGFGTNTKWAVIGGLSDFAGLSMPNDTLWSTKASAGAFSRASSGTQSALGNSVDGWVNVLSPLGGAGSTFVIGKSDPNSFTSQGPGAASPYSYFPSAVESSASGTAVMQLWQLTPGSGPGTDLGYFTLSSSNGVGTLTFTAIPEPTTYAAILGGVALAVAAYRRRRQVSLV